MINKRKSAIKDRLIDFQGYNLASYIDNLVKKHQRESFLRKFSEKVRNSFDINDIKSIIVKEVGKAFKADRCLIRLFDMDKNAYLQVDKHSEYLSSSKVKSQIGYTFDKKFNKKIYPHHRKSKRFIISDLANLQKIEPKNSFADIAFKEFGVKSNYSAPLFYDDVYIGALVLHYTKTKVELSDDDIKFLNSVSKLASKAVKQANSYSDLKFQTERSLAFINIINNIKNIESMDELTSIIVREAGEFFKADRSFYISPNELSKENLVLSVNSEYIASQNDQSFAGKDLNTDSFKPLINIQYLKKLCKAQSQLETFYKINNLSGSKGLNGYNISKSVTLPIFYLNSFQGALYLCWNNDSFIQKSELPLLKVLSTHIGSILYQNKHINQNISKNNFNFSVNKNLARNIGLNCAIVFSYLNSKNHCSKELEKPLSGIIILGFDELKENTLLSKDEQKRAVDNLNNFGLIKIENQDGKGFHLRIDKNSRLLNYFLSENPDDEAIQNILNDSNNQGLYSLKELCNKYSSNFSKEVINAARYYFERTECCKEPRIDKVYFITLCSTFQDFFVLYSVKFKTVKSAIDLWFNKKPSLASNLISFGMSKELIAQRLKKNLVYKLQEAKLPIKDFLIK